jgi:hypothetical protein
MNKHEIGLPQIEKWLHSSADRNYLVVDIGLLGGVLPTIPNS